MSYYEDFVK